MTRIPRAAVALLALAAFQASWVVPGFCALMAGSDASAMARMGHAPALPTHEATHLASAPAASGGHAHAGHGSHHASPLAHHAAAPADRDAGADSSPANPADVPADAPDSDGQERAPAPVVPGCPLAAGTSCAVTVASAPVVEVAPAVAADGHAFAVPGEPLDLLHVHRLLRPPNA